MSAPRPLVRNIRSALSGNSIYALCQLGMLSALAWLTTPVEVGRYALALAITAPVFLFTSLKLRQVQVTDAAGDHTFGEYLGHRIVASSIGLVGVSLMAALLIQDSQTMWTIVMLAIYKAAESLIDIMYGAMQRRERLHLVARSQMVRGLLALLAFGGAAAATGRADVASALLAAVTILQALFVGWTLRRMGVTDAPVLRWRSLRILTVLALPLGFGLLVSSLATNFPRYVIELHVGTAELGIFAALAYVQVVTGMIMNSVGEAVSPRLANHYRDQEFAQFRAVLKRLIGAGALIGILGLAGAMLLGQPALAVIFGAEYAARSDVLVVLMAASALLYLTTFVGTAINAMRRFKVQLPVNVALLAVVATTSWFMIPAWGLMGAAIATAAAQAVGLILYLGLLIWVVLPATRSSKPVQVGADL